MFNFTHRRTCKHPEVHLLRPPPMLDQLLGAEIEVMLRRWHRRRQAKDEEESRELSVPIPGLRDATTGSPSPSASHPSIQPLPDMLGHTWVCSRCGQGMGMLTTGCSTRTTIPSRPGS